MMFIEVRVQKHSLSIAKKTQKKFSAALGMPRWPPLHLHVCEVSFACTAIKWERKSWLPVINKHTHTHKHSGCIASSFRRLLSSFPAANKSRFHKAGSDHHSLKQTVHSEFSVYSHPPHSSAIPTVNTHFFWTHTCSLLMKVWCWFQSFINSNANDHGECLAEVLFSGSNVSKNAKTRVRRGQLNNRARDLTPVSCHRLFIFIRDWRKQDHEGGSLWKNHSNRLNLTEKNGNAVRSCDRQTITTQRLRVYVCYWRQPAACRGRTGMTAIFGEEAVNHSKA